MARCGLNSFTICGSGKKPDWRMPTVYELQLNLLSLSGGLQPIVSYSYPISAEETNLPTKHQSPSAPLPETNPQTQILKSQNRKTSTERSNFDRNRNRWRQRKRRQRPTNDDGGISSGKGSNLFHNSTSEKPKSACFHRFQFSLSFRTFYFPIPAVAFFGGGKRVDFTEGCFSSTRFPSHRKCHRQTEHLITVSQKPKVNSIREREREKKTFSFISVSRQP